MYDIIMNLIQFIRGKYTSYDKDTMSDSIFFATDTNTIIMNGEEYGSYPKDFGFVSEGSTLEKEVLCENYSPQSTRFYFTTSVDFNNYEYLQAVIDLSVSTNETGITVLSIGEDISGWNNSTIWFFYKKGGYSSGDNFIIQFGTHTYELTVDTKYPITISIKTDGIYINDDKKVGIEYGITYLKTLDSFMVGSYRSDSEETLSDAAYNRISVYEQIGSDGLTMSYNSNKNTKKIIELPLATINSNGVMSYKDKQALEAISDGVDGGTY